MKYVAVALLFVFSVVVANIAHADSDDVKWIARCMSDNKDANVAPEVIQSYCACMNNKMERSETQSVTQWEKTHPAERAECDKVSGWR